MFGPKLLAGFERSDRDIIFNSPLFPLQPKERVVSSSGWSNFSEISSADPLPAFQPFEAGMKRSSGISYSISPLISTLVERKIESEPSFLPLVFLTLFTADVAALRVPFPQRPPVPLVR